MKKVLFVANVLKKHIYTFHMPFLEKLKAEGYEVHVAAYNDAENEMMLPVCDRYYDIHFSRSPFDLQNIAHYRKLKSLVEREHFDIVHCHTPIVSALIRLACKKVRKNGTKIIYTAHGFHFYKGAPLMNRVLYYPIEKLCSKQTDVLITINEEDYRLAKQKMYAKKVEYVPGVGIDVKRFADMRIDREKQRKDFGVRENAFLLLSVGELSKNKNHAVLIRALAMLKKENIYLLIAGDGVWKKKLLSLAKRLDVADNICFLGYRYDIATLCRLSDLYVHPSYREGLPVAVMEAMASSLPVVCSDIRGNRDLIDKNGGILCEPNDAKAFADAIELHRKDRDLCEKEGTYNATKALIYEKKLIDGAVLQIYENEVTSA